MRALQKARRREHLGNAAMTDTPDDLVKQLREREAKIPAPELGVYMSRTVADPLCAEAADRISALEAEVAKLRGELSASVGYLLNAKFDLEAGSTKATAIRTIEGGIKRARRALAGDAG